MDTQKPIPFFEKYIVTKSGDVFNSKTGKTLKPATVAKGYYSLTLSNKSKHRREYVHRLVGQAFVPNPNNKPFINHKNGIKTDNRAENLEWVTPKENINHAYKIGLCPTKMKALQGAKLSEEEVFKIRKLLQENFEPKNISEMYHVHLFTIHNIRDRKTWKHI